MRHGSTRSRESAARLLGRLGIRSVQAKVTALVVIPLVLVLAVAVPLVLVLASAASAASDAAESAGKARQVGRLVNQLQRESVLAAALIADPSADNQALVQQQSEMDGLARTLDGDAVSQVNALADLRQKVRNRQASLADVADGYHRASVAAINGLGLAGADGAGARQLGALDALLRANEQRASRATALLATTGAAAGADRAGQRAAVYAERFQQLADAPSVAQFASVETGPAAEQFERLAAAPRSDRQFVSDVVNAAKNLADQRDELQDRLTGGTAAAVAANADSATRTAILAGSGAIVLFGLVTAFSVLAARAVLYPLRRLAGQARAIADLSGAELAQVAEPGEGPPQPPLPQLHAGSGDELAELAAAFNRLRSTAVASVDGQAATRRAGVHLLAGAAKRTQNLVSGQRAVVEELTRTADDPVLLAGLYRVDHAAQRLRRTADDLLVVSGSRDESRVGGPIELATALYSAAAEIDDESRVRFGTPVEALLAPSLGMDLVLLFAELLENAAAFSPPESAVEVGTEFRENGELLVTVVDHGIGLTAERLAEMNRRLAEPDAAVGPQLGLAAVARLAKRHSLTVELASTSDGGVAARVAVPQALFSRDVDFRRGPGLFEPGQVPDPRPLLLPAPAIAALSTPMPAGFRWFIDPEPLSGTDQPDATGKTPATTSETVAQAAPETTPEAVPQASPETTPEAVPQASPEATPEVVPQAAAEPDQPLVGTLDLPEPDSDSDSDEFASLAGTLEVPEENPEDPEPGATEQENAAMAVLAAAEALAEPDAADPSPTYQFTVVPPESRDGVLRRVPGAQLAPGLKIPQIVRTPLPRRTLRDPAAERAAFDSFSDGVAKAEQVTAQQADQGGS